MTTSPLNNYFDYKDCFTYLRTVGKISVFENSLDGCEYTIAIPTYNRTADLVMAIDSAINQDIKLPYNIIVVDNNPERNDETERIMFEKYGSIKNLSYYKNNSNIGMINNWNRLFELSSTQYVVMLHDDDVLYPNYLRIIDKIVKQEKHISIINAGKRMWKGDDIKNLNLSQIGDTIEVYEYTSSSNYPFFHFGAPSGCLFNRADVYEEGGFDDAVYPSSDYVFIQKMCMSKKKVLRTADELMLYKTGVNTSSKIETDIRWIEVEEQIKDQLSLLLGMKKIVQKIVKYYDIKLRVRRIEKQIPGYYYKKWSKGGVIFLVFYNIYKVICTSLITKRCIKLD